MEQCSDLDPKCLVRGSLLLLLVLLCFSYLDKQNIERLVCLTFFSGARYLADISCEG